MTSWLPSFARAPPTGGLKKLSIFSAVHKMLTPKTSTPPHPPPGFNIFCIDFLGSSWHFQDFWFFDPLKLPPHPPPRFEFFLDFLGSSWHFPDFWFFDPPKNPPTPPWDPSGVGKFFLAENEFIQCVDTAVDKDFIPCLVPNSTTYSHVHPMCGYCGR